MFGASGSKPPGSSITLGGGGSSSGGLCSNLVEGIVTCSGASALIMGSAGGWIGAGGSGSWMSGRGITTGGSELGPGWATLNVGPSANTAKWRATEAASASQTQARDCRLKRSLAVSRGDEPGIDAVDMEPPRARGWICEPDAAPLRHHHRAAVRRPCAPDLKYGAGSAGVATVLFPNLHSFLTDCGVPGGAAGRILAVDARQTGRARTETGRDHSFRSESVVSLVHAGDPGRGHFLEPLQ